MIDRIEDELNIQRVALIDGDKRLFHAQSKDRHAYDNNDSFAYIGKGKVCLIGGYSYSEEEIAEGEEVYFFARTSKHCLSNRFNSYYTDRWFDFPESEEDKNKRVRRDNQMNVGVGQAGFSYKR